MNILGFEIRRKAKEQQVVAPFPFEITWYGRGLTMIPANLTEFIRQGYAGNSTVYHIVKVQADKFSQIPFRIYKRKGNVQKYLSQTKTYNPAAIVRKASVMDELDESDEVYKRLMKPNDFQTESDFRRLWLTWLKVCGFSPIYCNTGLSGTKPLAISNLAPQWVTIRPNEYLTGAAEIWYSPFGSSQKTVLPTEQVYIAKYQNPDYMADGSHLYGLSPLKAALLDLKGSNEAKKAIAKMYENGGAIGFISPKETPVNQMQVDTMRQTLGDYINGNNNKGKIGAISFPSDYTAVGLDAVDMKLIEGGALTDQRIALAYNHPPALLQADNKYDNQQEAVKYLVTNTIYPDLVMYRDYLNTWLLPKFGRTDLVADFDITEVPELQEDMSKMVSAIKDAWWTTPNEKRAVMKYDDLPQPEMNEIYIPTGFMPISDAGMTGEQLPITEDYGQQAADNP